MSLLFNKRVKYEAVRDGDVHRLSFDACLMDGSFDQPLADFDTQSTLRLCTVVAKTRHFAGLEPAIGDIVTHPDGTRYAVKAIQPFYGKEYILDTRAC